MTISELASIGEFVSGVTVLITLAFLVVQMRQNTAALIRAENNATHAQFSGFRQAIINNREVAEIWRSEQDEVPALDAVDEVRLDTLTSELMWSVFQL